MESRILKIMQGFNPPLNEFRSDEQRDTILQVLRNDGDLMCPLPTSVGKNLLFTILALYNKKTRVQCITMVVVPLVAVIQQH
jgi:superfamily II DNA helicase RecQ